MIVIDASVAIKWVVDEADHDIAVRLAKSPNEFAAPSILIPELVNVLRKKVHRKEITSNQANLGAAKAVALIGHFVDVQDVVADLMEMSVTLNHAAYDCCYMVTALRIGADLVTADQILDQKAEKAGIKAYSIHTWLAAEG